MGQLKDLLYKIKVEEDVYAAKHLLSNSKVQGVVGRIVSRFKYNKSEIKKIANNLVIEFTISNYVYDDSEYMEERYLNFIKKFVGNKVNDILMQYRNKKEILADERLMDNFYKQKQGFEDIGEIITNKILVNELLNKLEDGEKEIITKLFYENYEEVDLAAEMGVTRQYINRVKNDALKKMKEFIEN